MNQIRTTVLTALAATGGAVSALFGGWDSTLIALVIFIGIDYITGLCVALFFHRSPKTASGAVTSNAAWKGLIKKGGELLVVLVAAQLSQLTGSDFIRSAVIFYFIGAEGLSILENGGLMGISYPQMLTEALEVLRSKGEQTPEGSKKDGEVQ